MVCVTRKKCYCCFFVDCAPYIACFWIDVSFAKDDLLVRLMSTMKKTSY